MAHALTQPASAVNRGKPRIASGGSISEKKKRFL
jgi:hypothetical protein